jgi:hypothetical protein
MRPSDGGEQISDHADYHTCISVKHNQSSSTRSFEASNLDADAWARFSRSPCGRRGCAQAWRRHGELEPSFFCFTKSIIIEVEIAPSALSRLCFFGRMGPTRPRNVVLIPLNSPSLSPAAAL